MSAVLTSAMLLQCFFSRPLDGSVPAGDIPTIKVPLPVEMAQSMSAREPPTSRFSFIGENGPVREWVIGNAGDATAANIQMLRVALSDEPLPPSPYSARFGTAVRTNDGGYSFENKMVGYCKLLPSKAAQQ